MKNTPALISETSSPKERSFTSSALAYAPSTLAAGSNRSLMCPSPNLPMVPPQMGVSGLWPRFGVVPKAARHRFTGTYVVGNEVGSGKRALLEHIRRSKKDAMTRIELFDKAGLSGQLEGTAKNAIKQLLAAGQVQRIGKGIKGNPYLYFASGK